MCRSNCVRSQNKAWILEVTGLLSAAEPISTLPPFFLEFISNKNEIEKVLSGDTKIFAVLSSKSENRGSSNRKKGYKTRWAREWGGLGMPLVSGFRTTSESRFRGLEQTFLFFYQIC